MTTTSIDPSFYNERIAPFLPPIVLDFHAHMWRKSDWHQVPWKSGTRGGTYMVAAEDYPVERLARDGRSMLPRSGVPRRLFWLPHAFG